MKTRSSRYAPSETKENKPTRIKKNNYLYDDLNNKIGIEEYVDINTQTRIDLMGIKEEKTKRENYHQLKEYQSIIGLEEKTPINIELEEEEEKVYNINDVLEEARKNRQKDIEKETRRKLVDEEYNVLNTLNEKYLIGKNEAEDIEGLQELIDSVTRRIPVEEIKIEEEKDLMSDLLETRPVETVDIVEQEEKEISTEENTKIDNSFYTKSMELSSRDFYDDDDEEGTKSSKRPLLISLVVLILIGLIVGVIYFILPMFK